MVHFENVCKQFRRSRVLNGIDLQIGQDERLALVGSNGAGKTTLIRCLLGEYNCGGSITIGGLDARNDRTQILKRVGFVPQLPPPLRMPVAQLLSFAAGVCDSDVEQMYAVADELRLNARSFRRQPFVKLSGGQKQKLLISIALGRDCDLLVMDEPAANLDPEARHIFFRLLAERQKDAAMIISSHRLDEVAALVNRVVELDRGNVVLDDRVADQVDMESLLDVRVTLSRADSAFATTVQEWGFEQRQQGVLWQGQIAGPDRLRFLGVLSRYAGLLQSVSMELEEKAAVPIIRS